MRRLRSVIIHGAYLLQCFCGLLLARAQQPLENWTGATVKATSLLDKDTRHGELVFGFAASMTRSGCHVAKVEGSATEQWVRLDGKSGRSYAAIGGLVFSDNGKTLAYVADQGGLQLVVINGKEGPAFDTVDPATLVLSADGRRHAYVARDGSKTRMVVDGVVHQSSHEPWPVPATFSADGKRVAFLEVDRPNRLMRAVIDGKPRPACGGIGLDSFVFSANGRSYSYSANIGQKWHRVIDDVVQPGYDLMGINFAFSPDGRRHAYVANTAGRHKLITDGVTREIPGSLDRGLLFSPDGKHLALAVATTGINGYVELDGVKQLEVERFGGTPPEDARPDNVTTYRPQRTGLCHGAAAGGLVFSPNSRRLAYPMQIDGRFCVIVDGQPVGRLDKFHGGLLFSPNSSRLAFGGERDGKQFLIVDGKEGPPFDRIGHFQFSADSRHTACMAIKGDREMVVIDGVERASYGGVPAGPVFRSDGVIELIATSDRLERIEVSDW